ncbi:something about silencing, SAS, complex subunit 4-domain-containing protein [Triangularia verruculosa]|uniref:Something about silencing, SAS, complex subunit 4-domain-containing protein n=1 Tax=Triangularia verruculosa TaxID=2587418 RepID=A0AAN7AZF3_9PEZI|nr:something about silencing, SAS, complex subunit 4-domain-containing protein [Triangularia verruculosa]
MTTSATRSRRADGPVSSLNSTEYHRRPVANSAKPARQTGMQFSISPPRANNNKRHLDLFTANCDVVVPKKARIAVEIPARPSSYHNRIAKESAPDAPPKPTIAAPQPRAAAAAAAAAAIPVQAAPPAKPAAATTSSTEIQPALTKHQEKVVNGLKHELNRLQPNAADTVTTSTREGRSLRSRDATRFKSELSAYFPEYDEVIGNDPKKEYLLNLETPLVVISSTAPRSISSHNPPTFPVQSYGDNLYTDLFDCQQIDFAFLEKKFQQLDPSRLREDTLPDDYYEPIHKKEEKQERSVRNTEKIRAQHERDQVIRLLDGLQGPDWLRVMGVSGVTESRKKTFEPARDYFIKGCESILDKFRRWTAEEKRRKREKDRKAKYQAERDAATSEERDNGSSARSSRATSTHQDEEKPAAKKRKREATVPDSDDEAMGDDEDDQEPPDETEESDVDASVAKQLQAEALAAAAKKKPASKTKPPPKKRVRPAKPPPSRGKKASTVERSPAPSQQEKEFKSFFSDERQREAALNKHKDRRRISARRNPVLAWGQAIPDGPETDFSLPPGLREEAASVRSGDADGAAEPTSTAATTIAKTTRGRPARGKRQR